MKKLCLLMLAILCVGCAPVDPSVDDSDAAANGPITPDHAHHHDHGDVGPNGGHLLHLEPTGHHAEWTHADDGNEVTVYLDEFESVDSAKFVATVQGSQPEEFALTQDGNGWKVDSEQLMTYINSGEAVSVQLVVQSKDGESTAKIEAHDDHEHHHH